MGDYRNRPAVDAPREIRINLAAVGVAIGFLLLWLGIIATGVAALVVAGIVRW